MFEKIRKKKSLTEKDSLAFSDCLKDSIRAQQLGILRMAGVQVNAARNATEPGVDFAVNCGDYTVSFRIDGQSGEDLSACLRHASRILEKHFIEVPKRGWEHFSVEVNRKKPC